MGEEGTKGFPPTSGVEASDGLSAKLCLCLPSKGIEKIASDKATGAKSGDWEFFVFNCK